MKAAPALLCCLLLLCACEELGNPGGAGFEQTDWTRWSGDGVVLTTRSLSAPSAQADRVIASVPREQLHHVDETAPASGVVTLVTVQPAWSRPPGTRVIGVVTELELGDGTVVRRFWSAPTRAAEWNALLGLPSAPRAVVTVVSH